MPYFLSATRSGTDPAAIMKRKLGIKISNLLPSSNKEVKGKIEIHTVVPPTSILPTSSPLIDRGPRLDPSVEAELKAACSKLSESLRPKAPGRSNRLRELPATEPSTSTLLPLNHTRSLMRADSGPPSTASTFASDKAYGVLPVILHIHPELPPGLSTKNVRAIVDSELPASGHLNERENAAEPIPVDKAGTLVSPAADYHQFMRELRPAESEDPLELSPFPQPPSFTPRGIQHQRKDSLGKPGSPDSSEERTEAAPIRKVESPPKLMLEQAVISETPLSSSFQYRPLPDSDRTRPLLQDEDLAPRPLTSRDRGCANMQAIPEDACESGDVRPASAQSSSAAAAVKPAALSAALPAAPPTAQPAAQPARGFSYIRGTPCVTTTWQDGRLQRSLSNSSTNAGALKRSHSLNNGRGLNPAKPDGLVTGNLALKRSASVRVGPPMRSNSTIQRHNLDLNRALPPLPMTRAQPQEKTPQRALSSAGRRTHFVQLSEPEYIEEPMDEERPAGRSGWQSASQLDLVQPTATSTTSAAFASHNHSPGLQRRPSTQPKPTAPRRPFSSLGYHATLREIEYGQRSEQEPRSPASAQFPVSKPSIPSQFAGEGSASPKRRGLLTIFSPAMMSSSSLATMSTTAQPESPASNSAGFTRRKTETNWNSGGGTAAADRGATMHSSRSSPGHHSTFGLSQGPDWSRWNWQRSRTARPSAEPSSDQSSSVRTVKKMLSNVSLGVSGRWKDRNADGSDGIAEIKKPMTGYEVAKPPVVRY